MGTLVVQGTLGGLYVAFMFHEILIFACLKKNPNSAVTSQSSIAPIFRTMNTVKLHSIVTKLKIPRME